MRLGNSRLTDGDGERKNRRFPIGGERTERGANGIQNAPTKNKKAGLGETHGFHRPSPPILPHGKINLGNAQVVRVERRGFKGFVAKCFDGGKLAWFQARMTPGRREERNPSGWLAARPTRGFGERGRPPSASGGMNHRPFDIPGICCPEWRRPATRH